METGKLKFETKMIAVDRIRPNAWNVSSHRSLPGARDASKGDSE